MKSFLVILLVTTLFWSLITGIRYFQANNMYRYCIRALLTAFVTFLITITPPYPLGFTAVNTILIFMWLYLFVAYYPLEFPQDAYFTDKFKMAVADVKKRG